MNQIYIKFNGNTYTAKSGIVTGAPNSVSLANCMLRYITKRLPLDNTFAIIWKRYIDDIICFIRTRNQQELNTFVTKVSDHFKEYDLNITVRFLNPNFDQLHSDGQKIENIEFLDIDHSFDNSDLVQTGLFVKPTAKSSTYLHPSSYHPTYIWDGILKGELTRIRKISSNEHTFNTGVQEILEKARRSEFSELTIDNATEMVKDWGNEKRLELLTSTIKKSVDDSVVWVTQLPTCVKAKFKKKLKDYLPKEINLRVAFQKPDSLQRILCKPRALEKTVGGCKPCGKCKLCGQHGKPRSQNMVQTATELKIGTKNYPIKSLLDCKSSGIYVAVCTQTGCEETYTGKTSNKFSTRFSGHRGKWVNAEESQQNSDDTALLDHYREYHKSVYQDWCKSDKILTGFDEAFKIYFVDKVGDNLTQQEDFWQTRLNSKINRCNIITPSITN